ncbi:MAG TPA: LamG-like jellyroll fold domain-containing protein [Candidatus Angelobacter sp.]|nr:LamG-like jellyroll fold domain-containing protein [Candidatus Angelobacter sp.]
MSSGAVSVATNSIVFASASSQSLTATGKTNINQQKFTFAAWFKTSTVATQALFYLGDGTTANRVFARINLNGTISFLGTTASASAFTLVTSGAFADGKWHSVVFAMNTTQAGANNRAIIYVDGVAAPLGINTQPAQNANLSNNFAATNLIGSQQPVAGTFFNGNLAQVYYIDGQQLTPSSFITGTPGVPKTYSGSYTGTFDFFLNFANAGSLGADTSGEGNNWTPQNSPTQSTDHP